MKESDIRSDSMVDEYLRLSSIDAKNYFQMSLSSRVPCVGCGSESSDVEFIKEGFSYSRCRDCDSLFLSPRPKEADFECFYRDSPSAKFWSDVFFPSVAEKRRELIFANRASTLRDLVDKKGLSSDVVVDVGAGHGIFLEEWGKLNSRAKLVAIEPSKNMAEICRKKGLDVVEATGEEACRKNSGIGDIVVSFEVIEHAYSPIDFLVSIRKLARPGGLVLISGLCCSGFDIAVLGKHSKSVHPPHHINFISIKGLNLLFERAGFKNVEVITPGELDMEIVRKRWKLFPELHSQNKFVGSLVDSDDKTRSAFQNFLKSNQLSSHVWAFGRV